MGIARRWWSVAILVGGLAVAPGPLGAADTKARVADSAGRAAVVTSANAVTTTASREIRPAPGRRLPSGYPYGLVSSEHLLDTLRDYTAIGAHQGWRCCGSRGEAEAIEFLIDRLARFDHLTGLGMDVERQSFRTIAGMDMWQSRLELMVEGELREVPADAPTGHPYRINLARLFDSDGDLTDSEPDPVVVEGPVVALGSIEDLEALDPGELSGSVSVLDYALVDSQLMDGMEVYNRFLRVVEASPSALVLVTTGSNRIGDSFGTFVGESSLLSWAQSDPPVPTLFARLEDMAGTGVGEWDDLAAVGSARMTWDTDIRSPGQSGNVVARIPGSDSSAAVILSAHLDSPNSPGALDNGSGTVALLEVARVLEVARIRPEVDVYLVWFGCHERGMHGSPHFAATHQEVLDRTLAIIELDALARPLDGIGEAINLESWSYARFGDDRIPLPDDLSDRVSPLGIDALTWDMPGLLSDVSGFVGYDVPNALLDNLNFDEMESLPSLHYPSHWHDPYDTVELAYDVRDVYEDLTRILLAAVIETGSDAPDLRVTPSPDRRAVFVGSHTEALHMSPTSLTELGMTLAWFGFDVDLVPYGQALTREDIEDADLVIVLPVVDYPHELTDLTVYDEAWTPGELDLLESYVDGGGFLIITNSAHRMSFSNSTIEFNEDWSDVNQLATRFGVTFREGAIPGALAEVVGSEPLTAGVETLWLASDNGVPFDVEHGDATVLATVEDELVVVLLEVGDSGGQVLVLSDLGIIGDGRSEGDNPTFWLNLAQQVR
jgi:hypothetical protein